MKKRRLAWITAQGGKCVDCGSTKNLQCSNDKSMNSGRWRHRFWSWSIPRLDAILAHCHVRCAVCQGKRAGQIAVKARYPHMVPKHGTRNRFSRGGCRCMKCCVASAKCDAMRNRSRIERKNMAARTDASGHDFGITEKWQKRICRRCGVWWKERAKVPCSAVASKPVCQPTRWDVEAGDTVPDVVTAVAEEFSKLADDDFSGGGGGFGGGGASDEW